MAAGYLYLGVASESEAVSGSTAQMGAGFSLEITYERNNEARTVIAKNDMHGYTGGQIYWDGNLVSSPQSPSLYEGVSHTFGVKTPQNSSFYDYVWHQGATNTSKWEKRINTNTPTNLGANTSVNYTTVWNEVGTISHTAYMRSVCNVTFNGGAGSTVTINVGAAQSFPQTRQVIELNPITATASNYSANGFNYTFLNSWTTSGGQVVSTSISPSQHETYTANYSASLSGNATLQSNILVPTGSSFTIPSGITVNLNGNSIISTGGTITNNGTIEGLRAQLKANTVLKGFCGSIQTAANYANNGNEIVLTDGNFNENVSISNKSDLTISGSSTNVTQFGTLTLTNCDYFYGYNSGAKSVYINDASYTILSNLDANGTNQSTVGFSLYNSDTYNVSNLKANYSQAGIVCTDGTEADIGQSFLDDNLNGLRSYNGSNVSIYNSYFCGTGLDLQTYNSSSIEAGNCYFDGGTPSVSGSNIYHYSDQNCSSYKISPNRQTENKDYVIVTNEDKPGGSEFDRINSAYFALNKKLTNVLKEKTDISKEAFSIDYEKVIEDFKEFIRNNPDSPLAKIALIASAKSYRRIDDLRGRNDFAGMKNFLKDIIENKEYSSLKPQAERLMIDYYRLTGNFKGAIETAEKLIENYKDSPDYVCGVLYAKGLIFAHDLNQPDKAAENFSYILRQYPENGLAALAENELRILGQEVGKQIPVEAEIVSNEIESNNYPNPFNPTTTISYSLPEAGNVQIKVYDVLGREVAKLVDETKSAGKHTITWNGSSNASGIYFYTITFNNQTLYKKMLMIK